MISDIETARSEVIERLSLTDPSYDASFDRIVRLLRTLSGRGSAAFTVLEGDRQFLKAHLGADERETARSVSFCQHTMRQPEILEVEDARQDARFRDNPLVCQEEGIRFYAGIVVRAPSGLPLGALCVFDQQPRTLNEEQRMGLADLRTMLEEALTLRSLSVLDALTGLFNRRHFEELASREWSRGFAVQTPVAVMMVDVDHFKKFNDTYGHAEGDICLRRVAASLHVSARRMGDVVARLGGEEFGMILPGTDAAAAALQAERLRATIAELDIAHQASPLGRVSVSIGICIVHEIRPGGIDFASALETADQALYRAKAQGRDRAQIIER